MLKLEMFDKILGQSEPAIDRSHVHSSGKGKYCCRYSCQRMRVRSHLWRTTRYRGSQKDYEANEERKKERSDVRNIKRFRKKGQFTSRWKKRTSVTEKSP